MSTLPDFTGPGFFAGEAPDGLTTIAGTPTSASVRVYWRDPADPQAPDALVASTQSAADGTWQIAGLNPALRYVVRAQKSQFDDVTVVGAAPSRSDVIAYVDQLVPREDEFGDVDGLTGYVLLDSGLPPFTCEVIQPLPFGLTARVDGRKLLIEGSSTDNGQWSSLLRVTASNGVSVDVPVQVEIQMSFDPHCYKVVALLHFDGDLTDETGRVWSQTGSPIIGGVGRFGGCITFSGNSSERVSSSHPAFGTDDWTVEMWVKFKQMGGQQNFFENLDSSGINPAGRFTFYQRENTLRVFVNSADRIITPTPIESVWHHTSVSCESGIVRLFVNGEVKGSWNSGGLNFDQTLTLFGAGFGTASLFGAIDELRITKGVARYTANFTPPDKPFPNR